MAAAFLFTRTTSQSPRLRETLVTVAITNRHCVPKMRTRAKMKVVAGDRARRENVPRHIPFCLADELNIITMQKKTSVTIFEKSLQNAEIFSEPIFLLETEKLLC